jgi:hypothetical protein
MNKATIIDTKAEQIVQETIADYNHGKVTTKAALLYKLLTKLKLFYEAANRPLMKKRYALGLPDRFEFNDTINEAIADTQAMVLESDNILSTIAESYTQVEFDRGKMHNMMSMVESLYERADELISHLEMNDVFIENFDSLDNFDGGACENQQANINTVFGYMTISLDGNDIINDLMGGIEILDGSNGFPGNTHQADSADDEVRFIGQDGMNKEIGAMIDQNADTWFEYELFRITAHTYTVTLGYGWNYQEGIKWITDKEDLRLALRITFPDLQEINMLSLSPFIPPDKDALPASITDITISDGRGNVQRLVEDDVQRFGRERVFLFPRQYVKTIVIELWQPYAYDTKIGHLYYQEITTDAINYFTQNELRSNKRTNEELPSSAAVGLIYDDEKQLYSQPGSSTGAGAPPQDAKMDLFSVPEDIDQNVRGDFEILPAKRFAIGVRNIIAENNRYAEIAEYVSIEYKTETPINSIHLDAQEEIPDIFDKSKEDKDWVRYFISVDDGENWHPIIPRGLWKIGGVEKYLVNSRIPYEMRSDNIGYIEGKSLIDTVKVKIELERPDDIPDAESYTPVVYGYVLQTM